MLKQIGLAVGKTAGKAALKITGHALMNAAGIQPGSMEGNLLTGMGNSIINSDAIGAMVNNLAGTNAGANPSNLQAALQGQPGADYQGIINALMQQQQQASTLQPQQSQSGPAVNYQALINELQKLQANAPNSQATAQQQSTAQLLALAQDAQNPSPQTLAQQQAALQQQIAAQTQALSQQQQALFQAQMQQTQALLNAASKQPQQQHHNQHHNSATSQILASLQQQVINSSNLNPAGQTDSSGLSGLFSGLTTDYGSSNFSGGGFGSSDFGSFDTGFNASAIADGFAIQDSGNF